MWTPGAYEHVPQLACLGVCCAAPGVLPGMIFNHRSQLLMLGVHPATDDMYHHKYVHTHTHTHTHTLSATAPSCLFSWHLKLVYMRARMCVCVCVCVCVCAHKTHRRDRLVSALLTIDPESLPSPVPEHKSKPKGKHVKQAPAPTQPTGRGTPRPEARTIKSQAHNYRAAVTY